jgi:hypothetical protein
MSFEVSTLWKALLAYCTFIRFLSSMSPQMDFKGAWSHEGLVTELTLEGSLSRVSPNVVSQMPLRGECFVAAVSGANEWFLSRMYSEMGLKISLLSEGLIATLVGAFKGFLSSLIQDMLIDTNIVRVSSRGSSVCLILSSSYCNEDRQMVYHPNGSARGSLNDPL